MFASLALGKGATIEPSEGYVVAPFDGTISTFFPTNHAIGIVSDDGIEVLVHVGINTVDLNGEHFTPLVKQNDRVKKGQRLLEFDIPAIKAAGYPVQTMEIITNTPDFEAVEIVENPDLNA